LLYLAILHSKKAASAKEEFEPLVCANSTLTAAQINATSH